LRQPSTVQIQTPTSWTASADLCTRIFGSLQHKTRSETANRITCYSRAAQVQTFASIRFSCSPTGPLAQRIDECTLWMTKQYHWTALLYIVRLQCIQ